MNAEWVEVDQRGIASSKLTKGDVTVKLAPSPFALPIGARFYEDVFTKRSGAEVRYLADEPLKCAALRDDSRVFFGRTSHRIYKIDVQAPAKSDWGALVRKLAEAIESYLRVYGKDSSAKSNADVFLATVRRIVSASQLEERRSENKA